MKYAIIFNGNFRTWPACRDSFVNSFNDIDYDLFLTTYNKKYGYHPYVKGMLDYHDDESVAKEEILQAFDGLNVKGVLYEDMSSIEKYINTENEKFAPEMKNIHSCFGQYRKIQECVELIKKYEESSSLKYDRIIKTRFDLLYVPFNKQVLSTEVAITTGNCYPNDHIYILERDQFERSNTFIMNEFYKPLYNNSHTTPPHTLLLNSFLHFNLSIKTMKMTNGVVRVNQIQNY